MCTVHWVSVCSGSPGDDKGIDNLPSCSEWGTVCNIFLYIISWDHELLVCSVLQGYIPSVSMTSTSMIIFLFLLSISFPFSIPWIFFLSLFVQFLLPVFFYAFSLKFHLLSSFLLLTCCIFSIYRTISMSGNQLWKLHMQINPCCQSLVMPITFWVLF